MKLPVVIYSDTLAEAKKTRESKFMLPREANLYLSRKPKTHDFVPLVEANLCLSQKKTCFFFDFFLENL